MLAAARTSSAGPITWTLLDVTFHLGGPATGLGGPIQAAGTFTYESDTFSVLDWNITVSNTVDPVLNFTYTPSSSFIPANYLYPLHLPGYEMRFQAGSSMIVLDFHDAPGGLLTDSGGLVSVLAGGSLTYNLQDIIPYGVETGWVTTGSLPPPPIEPSSGTVPEPAPILLLGTSLAGLIAVRRGHGKA